MGFGVRREIVEDFVAGGGMAEAIGLAGVEEAVAALGDAFEGEMAEGNAFHFFDGMQFLKEGAAENVEFGAGGVDFVPEIGGAPASGIGLADGAEARASVLAETIEFFEGEAALDLDVIDLRELGPGFEHGGGEIAIVGEKDEAGVGVVEGADRINALGKTAEEIAKCASALGIGERGDDFGRFVEDEVDVILFGFDEAAGGFDLVLGGIGLGAEFGDDLAVDANLTGKDELFGVAARGDAGVGDDFLEAVEHGELKFSVVSFQFSVKQKLDLFAGAASSELSTSYLQLRTYERYQRPGNGSFGRLVLETFYIEMGWGGGKRGKKRLTTEIAEEPQSSQ
jgi:hypothetical protein